MDDKEYEEYGKRVSALSKKITSIANELLFPQLRGNKAERIVAIALENQDIVNKQYGHQEESLFKEHPSGSWGGSMFEYVQNTALLAEVAQKSSNENLTILALEMMRLKHYSALAELYPKFQEEEIKATTQILHDLALSENPRIAEIAHLRLQNIVNNYGGNPYGHYAPSPDYLEHIFDIFEKTSNEDIKNHTIKFLETYDAPISYRENGKDYKKERREQNQKASEFLETINTPASISALIRRSQHLNRYIDNPNEKDYKAALETSIRLTQKFTAAANQGEDTQPQIKAIAKEVRPILEEYAVMDFNVRSLNDADKESLLRLLQNTEQVISFDPEINGSPAQYFQSIVADQEALASAESQHETTINEIEERRSKEVDKEDKRYNSQVNDIVRAQEKRRQALFDAPEV